MLNDVFYKRCLKQRTSNEQQLKEERKKCFLKVGKENVVLVSQFPVKFSCCRQIINKTNENLILLLLIQIEFQTLVDTPRLG